MADRVVAGVTSRKAVRSGVIWGYLFGISIASSAISYTSVYKTRAERLALAAAYGSNKATSALFGPAPQLQTVAGFTVFKISMTLIVLGAVWGLLTSTRLLRGEEDAGRWDLLLVGGTTRRRATAQALAGLSGGIVVLWTLTAAITVVTGRSSKVRIAVGPALYFALAMVATALMFLAVGALTSQLGATRRQAASQAATFLGIAYAIRLVADSGVGLHGLIWLSPLGWVEELQPLTHPQPLALVPIAVLTAALASAAVHLAGHRDVGASVLADRPTSEPHLASVSGPTRLAVRLVRPSVVGWWIALGISGLLYGLIAKSAGSTIGGSSVHQVFGRLGARGTGAAAVLGVCFLIVAVLVGFAAAGHVTMARAEEATGRLDHLLAARLSRTSWVGGRLLVGVVAIVVGALGAGVLAWLGAATQSSGVGIGSLLGAGANLVPPAVVVMGLGAVTFGVLPRAAAGVTYGYLAWSLVVVIVGGIGATNHWILDTSVFHHMASAPAVAPNWTANAIMIGLGAIAALAGAVAFGRRDIQPA